MNGKSKNSERVMRSKTLGRQPNFKRALSSTSKLIEKKCWVISQHTTLLYTDIFEVAEPTRKSNQLIWVHMAFSWGTPELQIVTFLRLLITKRLKKLRLDEKKAELFKRNSLKFLLFTKKLPSGACVTEDLVFLEILSNNGQPCAWPWCRHLSI